MRYKKKETDSRLRVRCNTEIPISTIKFKSPTSQQGADITSKTVYRNNTLAFSPSDIEAFKNYTSPSYHDNLDMREPPSAATSNIPAANNISSGIQQQYLTRQQVPLQDTRGGYPPPPSLTGGPQNKQTSGQTQVPGGQPPSIPQLQDMARRQQQQIEAQQQLLVAKEQRLKYLRQQDYRHHQMAAEYERLRRLREKVRV